MGNGLESMGKCYTNIKELMGLFENLSGLQQGVPSDSEEWGYYKSDVEIFLSKLRQDLLPEDRKSSISPPAPTIISMGWRWATALNKEFVFGFVVNYESDCLVTATLKASGDPLEVPTIPVMDLAEYSSFNDYMTMGNQKWVPPDDYETVVPRNGRMIVRTNAVYLVTALLEQYYCHCQMEVEKL